jgi:hypothetical protein
VEKIPNDEVAPDYFALPALFGLRGCHQHVEVILDADKKQQPKDNLSFLSNVLHWIKLISLWVSQD